MTAVFEESVVLVTGGGSGIGEACSLLFAERGARVVVADIDLANAERVAAEADAEAAAVQVDVSDADACGRMVGAAVDRFGRLDIALNVAGIGIPSPPTGEIDPESWRRVLSVNLDGVFYSMRAEIPAILAAGGGTIVNMASALATIGSRGSAAYVASKHGVLGLTRAAALEYADQGLRINAVGPGVIETPLTSSAFASNPEIRDQMAALHPIGRLGQPREVAELVAFLASDAASFCTGGWYAVDGAWTAA